MTQKPVLFKGQQKKKTLPPSRHGKPPQNRKGKRFIKPSKITKDMEMDKDASEHLLLAFDKNRIGGYSSKKDVTKFINQCNEIKAATVASKEGGQFSVLKTSESNSTAT